MSNQLRLEVAQLTDVGRKREHNEDNMAYVIPKDDQVMALKGALFIVADGMGGHAAGEVASEIAVDTVSNVYYMDDNIDVAAPLLQAIKRANAAIHQRASENMLRSGMGTTCVAAVLRGNVAYIANVGDSRAYLVRQGKVRQISLDHSWVAEQVRAGLLTEEQARTHAQRNVITRSLGTQPDVEVDIFREPVQAGDFLVLCSDGLSGLISDEELMRIVEQSVPQESVYHLVERANENGGPDNITAIVVHVQETGVEPPGARNPVLVGGREVSDEETIALNRISGGLTYAVSDGRAISGPLRLSSGPLASPESVTAPQPALTRARRSRLFYPTLLLIFLIIVALAGGGVFYALRFNESQTISQSLSDAGKLISNAGTDATNNPAKSLNELSTAQNNLNTLKKNHQLDSGQSSQFDSLQNQLVNQTNTAIKTYNTQAKIFPLTCYSPKSPTVNVPSAGGTSIQVTSIAAVQNAKGAQAQLFALGSDGALYQLNQQSTGYQMKNVVPPSTTNMILAIASGGSQLFVLNEQLKNSAPTGSYSLNMYIPDQSGALGQPQTVAIDPQSIHNGYSPSHFITAWGNQAFVVLSSAQTNVRIIDYTPDKTNHLAPSEVYQLSVSPPITSVAAFSKQFFLVQQGGQVQSFPLGVGTQTAPSNVLIQAPIQPPLAVAPGTLFTQAMPVPVPVVTTPVTSGHQSLIISNPTNATQLTVGVVNNTAHLYAEDPSNRRVIDLVEATSNSSPATPTGTPTIASVTMQLIQQYASPQLFKGLKSIAVAPDGTTIYLLAQQTGSAPSLVSISTTMQSGCTS